MHAHSVLAQTATGFGVPGAVAVFALLAAFGYIAACAFGTCSTANERAVLIGICGAIAAWLAYALPDRITLGHKPAAALWVIIESYTTRCGSHG